MRQGAIQTAVLYDTDRLTREHWHSGFLRLELREYRVRLIIVNQLLPTEMEGTPEAEMILGQKSVMDQYFGDVMIHNTTRGRKTRAEKKLPNGGMTPLGYRRVSESHGGRFEVDPEEAAVG